MKTLAAIALNSIALITTATNASPPQEWERFRRETEQTCLRALRLASAINATDHLEIQASYYGSQRYGTALVTATDRRAVRRYVCVMDKGSRQTEFAEIDGPPTRQ